MDPALSHPTDTDARDLMDHLAIADPEAAQRMRGHLTGSKPDSAYIHRLAGWWTSD
jgi:hypothetical protein